MGKVRLAEAVKILNKQEAMLKTYDEIIDILKRENKALKEELEKKTV